MRLPKSAKRTTLTALAAVAAMTLSACASESEAEEAHEGPKWPVVVETGYGPEIVPAAPKRIVSLSPTATETLFAVGAGPRVVAVDSASDYPATTPRTPLSAQSPDVAAVLAQGPDLVVTENPTVVEALRAARVPVLLGPPARNIDEANDQILDIGTATGHREKAAEVNDEMRLEIRTAVGHAEGEGKGVSYFLETSNTGATHPDVSAAAEVFAKFGMRNVAYGNNGQLPLERVRAANPDVVFLADTRCCAQSATQAAQRPGWADSKAVVLNSIFTMDDGVGTRWGPRLGELAHDIELGLTQHEIKARFVHD